MDFEKHINAVMRWIVLTCLGVSEISHPHKIKASIFKILTWNSEEIVLLNE